MRFSWLLSALFLSLLLTILHLFALYEYLYWRLEWFDVFMHYLGGLAIGVFLIGFFEKFRPLFFLGLFSLLMVSWEVFEYIFGIPREANYFFDTALDFLMDALGALTAYACARCTLWRFV